MILTGSGSIASPPSSGPALNGKSPAGSGIEDTGRRLALRPGPHEALDDDLAIMRQRRYETARVDAM